MTEPQDRILHPVEEARHLLGGIGVTKFYELVACGDLELVHIGRRSVLTDTEIRRYVDELVARQAVA